MSKVGIVPIGQIIKRKREKCNTLKADVYSITKESGFVLSDSLHDFSIYSDDVSNYSIISKNDFAYNPSRLNIGSFALFNKEIGIISPMYVVFSCNTEIIVPKYLYYYIKSPKLLFQIDSMKEVGARFRFDFSKWLKIEIPLPHIKVQEEIVKILDSFTNLIDALNEELSLRQKQFEYYREKLLTFKECECEWKKLGDFAEIKTGKGIVTSDCTDKSDYPVISGGIDIMGYYSSYNREAKTVTISRVGANAGFVNYITTKFYLNDKCFSVIPRNKSIINNKYLFYLLKNKEEIIKGLQSEGGVPTINTMKLGVIDIPIPPLAIQQSIVEKLDAFESLISSLKEEIALRQKQYEYYREKLLTFE